MSWLPLPLIRRCQRLAYRFWCRLQRRHGSVRRLVRAGKRYRQADGRRLAAAVSYYGFFATFAMVLLGFAALGYVVDDPGVQGAVQRFLDENLPRVDTDAVRDAREATGLIAFASLLVIGLLWVDSLRSSVRAIWRIEEYPGGFFRRWFIDGLALVGLGTLLAVSLTVALGAEALLGWLVELIRAGELAPAEWLLLVVRFGLNFSVNTILAIAALTLLPRLRMPLRRVLPPALLVAAGAEFLTSVGRLVVDRAEYNPAFQVVAGAAGLLVFLLILNQLILFAASLTATAEQGRVVDLARRNGLRGSYYAS
ncbi:YihY/virulence factor BrkB family protein [Natronosporangium hydrolyticum]|uniref:YihY/virulence factor BrkB family protein n=1 Tax=Natronosporangium hydrolyticum TaxID=2811111 RepID=UPI001EFA1D28|nr:YihY/virulence factor BrkB family protein [Natronosporangium hydrolyticum]